jgi:GNAT superfamily N-acetyltransferase
MSFQARTADQVDPEALFRFYAAAFPDKPAKVAFLRKHGEWLYRGWENSVVIVDDTGQIVGHSGFIPAELQLAGQKQSAYWWVDLVILPDYRGQGLHHLLDAAINALPGLKVAFTNPLSTSIFLKRGWQMAESGHYMALPLQPLRISHGLGRLKAALTLPRVIQQKRRWRSYTPQKAELLPSLDGQTAAVPNVFMATERDEAYLRYRFSHAPYANQLRYYGNSNTTLVTRLAQGKGFREMRLLDIWGDLGEKAALSDLIQTMIQDALAWDAARVWTLACPPTLRQTLEEIGFKPVLARVFTWYSPSADVMNAVAKSQHHWTLADSDNDTVG